MRKLQLQTVERVA